MGSTGTQVATKAVSIDNMNEKQLDNEIAKAQRGIRSAENIMAKNGQTQAERDLQNAFPLGVGGDGWTQQRINQRNKQLESSVNRAKAYTDAYEKRNTLQKRLDALQKAKETVKGTGKTAAQIKEEKSRQAVKNTVSTLNWKTTQKGGFSNGGYTPRIIKAGNIEIHGSEGLYTIYKDGKQLGRTDKLSKAKAYAERIK